VCPQKEEGQQSLVGFLGHLWPGFFLFFFLKILRFVLKGIMSKGCLAKNFVLSPFLKIFEICSRRKSVWLRILFFGFLEILRFILKGRVFG